MNNWRNIYRYKICSAAQAVQNVKSGNRVVIANACSEPQVLLEALAARGSELNNVEMVQMLAMGPAKTAQPGMENSFRHNILFVSASTRKAVEEKRADFTPCFFSEIPRLFKENILPVDVMLVQVTPPDEQGFCSYGISVDYTQSAAETAHIVIAQINPSMPRTGGASIHLDAIDFIVEHDEAIIELQPPKIGEIERAIGENVGRLISDGATLQLGIGAIPDAVLLFLNDKKDLGIHSEMFSDGVVNLVESGVINNRKKTLNPGKCMATFLMGTKRLYDFVNNNPDVELHSVDYINDPCIIGQHENMVSINSAIQVDLMGQVNAEMVASRQFSAIGGQVDFIRGASRSKNGKSIIALPSTASGGEISRITCELDRGAAVSTTRNDVHYVVTEYGIANLRGKTIRERCKALLAIAHPDFRVSLMEEAKNKGML